MAEKISPDILPYTVREKSSEYFTQVKRKFWKKLVSQADTVGSNGNNYILIFKVMYDFASWLLISPFYLKYDEIQHLYLVKKCSIVQRTGCIGVLILSTISAYKMLQGMTQNLLANPGYIGAYFDFMNGVILHAYLYTVVYFQWFKVPLLRRFVRILQTSPLVRFYTIGPKQAIFLPIFCWLLTFYMAIIWMIVVYGFDPTGLRAVTTSCDALARQIFWLENDDPVSPFLDVMALIGRFYNGFLIHLSHNVFGPCVLFLIHWVTTDFFVHGVIKVKTVDDLERVLGFYYNYTEFIDLANGISGPHSIHFILMVLSYHSIHLFDALNVQNFLWKINTYLYLAYLFNFLLLPAKTILITRRMKKWLWEGRNYLTVPKQELSMLLYDLTSKRLGVKGGKFFIFSPRFSGLIVQHLLSYSMLNTINRKYFNL